MKQMDWRSHLASNQRKTLGILLSFVGLYFLMGWLVVAFISPSPTVFSLDQLQDVNNQWVIFCFILFSLIFIFISVFFGGRLSLSGTNAIKVDRNNKEYQRLYHIVEEMKIASGLRFMPKIYVLPVKYNNAFAAGWSEKNAVVAVSKPLLELLSREELQAVIAHELSHIKHQDTRVMTLVMVCASLLISIVDVMCRSVTRGGRRSKKGDKGSGVLVLIILLVRLILPILTAFMVMYTSRRREYLADAGCVKFTRNAQALAKALVKIHKSHSNDKKRMKKVYEDMEFEGLRSLAYIYSPKECGISNWADFSGWFSTHPSLEDRLRALGIDRESI